MKIPLMTRDGVWVATAAIDDEDFDSVASYRWHPFKSRGTVYARARDYNSDYRYDCVFMHRLICRTKRGRQVDHVNGNGLDNRRSNLRNCDHYGNAKNRRLNSNSKTGFKGVRFEWGKFRVVISSDKKRIHLGMFDSAIEAAAVYDEAARKYHGEFARTNKNMGLL